ncbi:uncharacterized protein N7515_001530 [Penicillium bovifimosum]|uniref:HIT-type domain-containing protein n=1 Tax=Penicillium bovifimosum TaxID=126998 RepID=A0A9W9L8C1_9EURO|nr:uncharacterized protein N7515_001530 [Penicillium bovifimosum]KAJ5142743.1 hypothetical protein N7515_001530 [Penicillium bovifimosum]
MRADEVPMRFRFPPISIRGPVAKSCLFSCSLACTQAHKIYCAPKAPSNEEPSIPPTTDADPSPENEQDDPENTGPTNTNHPTARPTAVSVEAVATSAEMKELLGRYPELRTQLQEMYQSTLEEEWVESYMAPTRGRGRGRGRGGRGGLTARSRGPWTTEKGFNRGLGRVRKMRQDCEEGTATGRAAEGFMQFMALIRQSQESV